MTKRRSKMAEIPIPADAEVERFVDGCVAWGMKLESLNERLRWLADNDWWRDDAKAAGDPDRYDGEIIRTLSTMLGIHLALDIIKGKRDPETLRRYTFKLRYPKIPKKILYERLDELYMEALCEIQNEEDRRTIGHLGPAKAKRRRKGRRAR